MRPPPLSLKEESLVILTAVSEKLISHFLRQKEGVNRIL